MTVLNANRIDAEQSPRSAASDLGLHCLPMSLLWDAKRLIIFYFTVGNLDFRSRWLRTLNLMGNFRITCDSNVVAALHAAKLLDSPMYTYV